MADRPSTTSLPALRFLLAPLADFCAADGRALPLLEECAGEDVPEPYRGLLVHNGDMTPTLERFHGDTLHLRILGKRMQSDRLARQVLLLTDASERPVEYGAIEIRLDRFEAAAREEIEACRKPLGAILRDRNIPHSSRPTAYFRVAGDRFVCEALGVAGTPKLYGRRNTLRDEQGRTLAEIVEILPL